MLSQFQNVLGVKFESHDNPVQTLYQNLKNIGHSNKNALAVGLISIAYLITIKLIKKRFFPSPVLSKTQEKKTTAAQQPVGTNFTDSHGFSITDEQYVSLPSTRAQTDENRPKALNRKSIDDSVKSKVVLIAIFLCSYIPLEPWYGFDDGLIGGGRFGTILLNSFTVVLVVSLSSIAMSKRLAIQRGEDIDTAQELTGIGIASVVCGFFQAMPPAGRMSRTAVNMQHGHTQLASIITTLIVVLSLYTLIGTLYYLPRATLASIIIVAGYTLVEFNEAKRLYRVGVLEGLIASIICSVLALMIKTKRTPVVVLGELDNGTLVDRDLFPNAQDLNDIIVIRVESSLYFANCERVALAIEKKMLTKGITTQGVVFDAYHMHDLDATTIQVLSDIQEKLAGRKVRFAIANANGRIHDILVTTNRWKMQSVCFTN
ncbi:hypothetical protein PPTG_19055 [Phytophthora nicotianae INRA-310]|uniref:STAS domain-containing protein n=1 Tax=Phytophthora nicotianae (strain INRA-310) TaxID=761204 RepID=W2PDZ2_PHYN3|nr:hypothetical protein PPTG_19055 [Phytophthora nicotianae INRA-310]ETM99071.1 hypothetical protein PPTG_19055 [Phytophthora nicotianae INRA-310]